MSAVKKALYKPMSIVFSVGGGLLAGWVFNEVWQRVSRSDEEPPEPKDLTRSGKEALIGAALHGLIFGLVRAAVDRAGAKGYQKLTHEDPR